MISFRYSETEWQAVVSDIVADGATLEAHAASLN
jgi:hypothetical protein